MLERQSTRRLWLIVGAVMGCLAAAAAGGGLAVWFLWPRPNTPPQSSNAPVAAVNDAPKDAPKEPAPAEVKPKPQQQLQAERKRSRENLEKIALAFHNHGDALGRYPPSAVVDQRMQPPRPLLSWRVLILPFLDEEKLFREFKLDEPWDSPHNKKLLAKMPKIYAPVRGKTPEPYMTYYQVFTGPVTAFPLPLPSPWAHPGNSANPTYGGAPFPARITDGTHNTLLVVEAGEPVPWTKPADLVYDAKKPLPKLGGLFPDGFHVSVCDGTVFFIPHAFDEQILRALVTCSGAELVSPDDVLQSPADDDQTPLDDKTINTYLASITVSPSPSFRLRAVKGLSRLLQEARSDKKLRSRVFSARQALSKATWDRDAKVSRAAIEALALFGSPTQEAVFALLASRGDRRQADSSLFEPIAQAIAARGAAVVPALLEALNHEDYDVRTRAVFTLRLLAEREQLHVDPKFPTPRQALRPWENWLTWIPRNSSIRRPLIEREKRFVRALEPAANDRDAAERTLTLLEILHEDPGDIQSDQSLRERAIAALAKIGPLGRVAIPDLFGWYEQTAWQISTLMKAGTLPDPFARTNLPRPLPDLTDALAGDPATDSRRAQTIVKTVHRALDRKGTPAANPDLDRLTSLAATKLLAILRCPKEPPHREEAVPPPDVRGAPADERVRRMMESMKKPDRPGAEPTPSFWSNVQAETARALGRIGPAAKDATPDLQRMLKDKEEICRFQAARALLLIDPSNRKLAEPVLKECLTSQTSTVAI